MATNHYETARASGEDVVWLDERPYLPNLQVSEENDSMVSVVQHIFRLLKSKNISVPELPSDNTVSRVQGGATNRLYRIGDGVLLRIFGAPGMIDRDEETAVYATLSTLHLAPPYYGRFANGRLEGWMQNMRTLTTPELPMYASSIALQLKRLHDSTPHLMNGRSALEPTLWQQLHTWLEQAESYHHENEILTDLVKRVRPEIAQLQERVHLFSCRVGFCHNDLLAANILVNDNSNTTQLIDFEYGGINYCSFDIANHWNEYAGCPPTCTDPDYSLLPNTAVRRTFLESYANPSLDEKEVEYFLLVNHLYWGLWAVNQSATEGNDEYNYARYAMNRIGQYFMDKEKESVPTPELALAAV